jgi:uncharacterized membrane protein
MAVSKNRRVLVASLSGALALPLSPSSARAAEGDTVHCYGVNKCKGTGDCGGKGRSCAGTNECKRAGYIDMDKDTCLRLDGGRLTEEPAADEKAEEDKDEKKG